MKLKQFRLLEEPNKHEVVKFHIPKHVGMIYYILSKVAILVMSSITNNQSQTK